MINRKIKTIKISIIALIIILSVFSSSVISKQHNNTQLLNFSNTLKDDQKEKYDEYDQ